jgi:ribonuclease R
MSSIFNAKMRSAPVPIPDSGDDRATGDKVGGKTANEPEISFIFNARRVLAPLPIPDSDRRPRKLPRRDAQSVNATLKPMHEFPSDEGILRVFEARPAKTFRLREVVEALGLRSSEARQLKSTLRDLAKRRKILYLKKNHFVLARHGALTLPPRRVSPLPRTGDEQGAKAKKNVVSGRLIGHRDGYGFVVPDHPVAGAGQDIFVPPAAVKDAMHGDRVEVQVFRSERRSGKASIAKLEGAVLRVLERAQKTVVGEFHCGPGYNFVTPFDYHISHEIVILPGDEWPQASRVDARNRQFGGESAGPFRARKRAQNGAARDLDGMIVDVEITRFPVPHSSPRGRVVEILGRRDEFGVDVEIMIRKFHLPHRFPAEVLDEAEDAPQIVTAQEREDRLDFRALPIVTIDGETAKDFDDAVYVERLKDGHYGLQVHIADVAHYVRPGTGLDQEARLRGTSVYFPDRAVPMLPLELSNGICSLNPHVDRLAMSVLMEMDADGKLVECRLSPGIIRSAERMTYTAVNAVFSGDGAACQQYRSLASEFKLMEELARLLSRRRETRGSIDFDLPEPEIEFDPHGQMTGITRSERNIAHRIIEEFMLAANEAVAAYLERKNIPSLYRIHEKPDPKKVIEFEEIAATFGYSLGVELPPARRVRLQARDERERHPRFHELSVPQDLKITSRHYQHLTQRIAGKPEERILSYLMLRSLKQARYSEENEGHFALAARTYTHFTSPIRRYPDLIVHRILKAALRLEGGAFLSQDELHALGMETSEAERRAAEAERELMDWKKVTFMAGRIGDEFDALIISLTRHGFFVELVELFVEGFVSIESLGDADWIYRERLRAIVHPGKSGRAYRLGDRITVRLDRIDRTGNKLLFSVIE